MRSKICCVASAGLLLIALTSCGKPAAKQINEAELFYSAKPITKGEVIDVSGTVFYDMLESGHMIPEASDVAYLTLPRGEFSIVMDAKGLEMVTKKNGQKVAVHGVLTGNATQELSFTPNSSVFSEHGTVQAVRRAPELVVKQYQ